MPESTLNVLAQHQKIGTILSADGGDCLDVLARFAKHGVDVDELAIRLQEEGTRSFVESWRSLMGMISSKATAVAVAG
jgi:transaldolase